MFQAASRDVVVFLTVRETECFIVSRCRLERTGNGTDVDAFPPPLVVPHYVRVPAPKTTAAAVFLGEN